MTKISGERQYDLEGVGFLSKNQASFSPSRNLTYLARQSIRQDY
jgi:hypothetical protein